MNNNSLVFAVRFVAGLIIFSLIITYLLGQEKNMKLNYKYQKILNELNLKKKIKKELSVELQHKTNLNIVYTKATQEHNTAKNILNRDFG